METKLLVCPPLLCRPPRTTCAPKEREIPSGGAGKEGNMLDNLAVLLALLVAWRALNKSNR